MNDRKKCPQCSQVKLLTEFNKSSRYGHQGICKSCKAEIQKQRRANPPASKQCSKCRKVRPHTQFLPNERSRDGLAYSCKVCKKEHDAKWFEGYYPDHKEEFTRWYRNNPEAAKIAHKNWLLQNQYGITFEQYVEMLTKQGGVCAICKKPETAIHNKTRLVKNLAVDHCHETDKVRGLLCGKCNTALGLLNHDVNLILATADYTKLYQQTIPTKPINSETNHIQEEI